MSWLTGVVVLIGAAAAWLVSTVAVAQSTDWSVWAVLPLTLLFGLLLGAVTWATAVSATRGWGVVGRGTVAVLVGVVIGELAAVVLLSSSPPTVAQAQVGAQRAQAAQTALDNAVEQARIRGDEAMVVARCEFNPSPACPQTRITGIPGRGPETRTANDILADTQRELDRAVVARDRHISEVTGAEQTLQHVRNADRGLGARWVAMHEHTLQSAGAMVLWAVTLAFFVLLSVLPLILKLMRPGSRSDRAEFDADTAISTKRAQVRAEIENMWAEQQLASARLAIAAQNEIDREMHHRRVIEALDAPTRVIAEAVEEDVYLPIEAEAASRQAARTDDERDGGVLPNVTKTAVRWIRPFVPPVVARAIDTTTHPLRTARQVFEEVEEITFTLKRTHKVTVHSEESGNQAEQHSAQRVATARPTAPKRHREIEQRDARRELPPPE